MPIQGKKFVFTGKISISREEAWNRVLKLGGDISSSVTQDCDYAVVGTYKGEEMGSKFFKAQQYGIKILTEQEFFGMLESPNEVVEDKLSDEDLKAVLSHLETVKCSYCEGTLSRWKEKGRKEDTCVRCSLKVTPNCPNCDWDLVVYVEDIAEYVCNICGLWFKGPRTLRSQKVQHYCKIVPYITQKGENLWLCKECARPFYRTEADLEEEERKLKEGPELVRQIRRQKEEVQELLRKKAEKFLADNAEDLKFFEELYERNRLGLDEE